MSKRNQYHSYNELRGAIAANDKAKVQTLIQKQLNIDNNKIDNSLLHLAIYYSEDVEIIKMLLHAGVDIYAKNNENKTPLYIAINHNKKDATLLLLRMGALAGEYIHLLLHKATVNKNFTIVKMLIQYGIKYKPTVEFQYYFNIAYFEGHKDITCKYIPEILVTKSGPLYRECVRVLLESNFTINPTSHHNVSFIHTAVEKGYSPIVSQLLKLGIDVNMVNPQTGLNLLTTACLHKYDEIVENLLIHKANVNEIIPYETWISINQIYFDDSINFVDLMPSKDMNSTWNLTCLHIAVFNSDQVITKILLKYHARILDDDHFINITSFAARNNDIGIVRTFLEHVWFLEYGTDKKDLSLFDEIVVNTNNNLDSEYIQLLLKLLVPIHLVNGGECAPLLSACKNETINQLKVVEELLHYGANINHADSKGMTALHFACDSHNLQLISILLKNGADSNAKNGKQETPLHLICKHPHENDPQIIKLLLKHYANIDAVESQGWTPLFVACYNNNSFAVKCLLENYANPNFVNNYGVTVFHYTWMYNLQLNPYIHELFLDYNVNLEAATYLGLTPLMRVCEEKNSVAVKWLLDHDANPNARNNEKQTCLHLSCKDTDTKMLKIMRFLLEYGADIEAVDRNGQTPLHIACDNENHQAIKCLLDDGANSNAVDCMGRTPLHLICKSAHKNTPRMIQLLLDYNANIDAIDKKSQTPLFLACNSRNDASVKFLLKHNANPNHTDINSETPLHWAVKYNYRENFEITQILISKGAKLDILDVNNRTPLYYIIEVISSNPPIDPYDDDIHSPENYELDKSVPQITQQVSKVRKKLPKTK